jgi:hypothetical protein
VEIAFDKGLYRIRHRSLAYSRRTITAPTVSIFLSGCFAVNRPLVTLSVT